MFCRYRWPMDAITTFTTVSTGALKTARVISVDPPQVYNYLIKTGIAVDCTYYIVNYRGSCLSVQDCTMRKLSEMSVGSVRISNCVLSGSWLPTRNPELRQRSGHRARIISFGRHRDPYPYRVCRFNCSNGRTNPVCVGIRNRTFCTRHPCSVRDINYNHFFFFFDLVQTRTQGGNGGGGEADVTIL